MEIDGESYNVVPILVEGLHRRAALRGLGIKTASCRVLDVDEVGAELIEIAENLHRNDLNKLQRDEQLARWIELTEQRIQSDAAQSAPHRKAGQQPGGINEASRELGVERTDAQRAIKVASLSEEAKDAARKTGLDNNRTALLEAAKAPKEEQATIIRDIAEKKSADRNKIDDDVQARAAREVANMLAEYVPGGAWSDLKANLYAAKDARRIANELTNISGQSIMDRRYGS
jgi:ParB family chromosome partitioning protein